MSFENIRDLVIKDLEQVNEIILDAAKNEVDLIPTLANHLIESGGKRIRPLLTLASARMCGYEGNRHIKLAAAVEFMHTATLLHDDVVDESAMRRGRKTANNIWGNKASVLVGDYLLGRAFQMMARDGSIKVLTILSDAAAKIAEGEVMQLTTANNLKTTFDRYIDVIKGKTAELFAAAAEVGAAIIGDERKQKHLRTFGENFGIAFQIIDDVLDYAADQKQLGKSVGDDLREGKVTLPVIYAYEQGSDEDKTFWQEAIESKSKLNRASLNKAKKLLQKTNALALSAEKAREYSRIAAESLDIFPNSPIKLSLIEALQSGVDRKY